MTNGLATIFSTGDAGAARGALAAAAELNLKSGGHTAVPDLPAPYADHLRRTLAPRMAARLNVQDSDGTLIVSFSTSLPAGSGAAYADEAAVHQRKPLLHIVLPDGGRSALEDVRKAVLAWVAEERLATLHVTGPREAEEPGIQQAVHDALVWIFEDEVQQPAVLTLAGAVRVAAAVADADGDARARAMFAGVDRATPVGSVVDTIARIAADLPNRPVRPPLTTDDALRQVAATGDDDARLAALVELARRHGQPTHIAINPANVDAAIAAGLDVQVVLPGGERCAIAAAAAPRAPLRPDDYAFRNPPPVPPEVWAARDRLLGEAIPAGRVGLMQQPAGEGHIETPPGEFTVTREEHYRRLRLELPPGWDPNKA